jgi:4-amino-4-deoxy-L-arabinose transferase-like glycosyltransferase
VIVILVVFAGLISPRAVYFLPAYPALALIAAWAWQSADDRERRWLAGPLGLGVAAVIVAAIISAVWPSALRIRALPLPLPPQSALITGGVLLAVGLVALRFQRRGASAAAAVVLAGGVATTLLTMDVLVRAPYYNRLYQIRAAARQLETRIPPQAEVGFTDRLQLTALAVHLSRPVIQLSAPELAGRPTPAIPLPRYVLLPEPQFAELAEKWSLQRVDEVRIRKRRYVLAIRGDCASCPSPGR